MTKVLDLKKSVYELVKEYPEIKDIMKELGFAEITSAAALNFLGRRITIPRGAKIKNIPLDQIIGTFQSHGFEVINARQTAEDAKRIEQLKKLIKRVGNGEDIEAVRKDFVDQFESVSVHEIAEAEQGLINDGMPVQEVQKLCDLHSALFHGRTEAEIYEEETQKLEEKGEMLPDGHPVSIMHAENNALEKLVNKTEEDLKENNQEAVQEDLLKLKKIRNLYGKKEMIMPFLDKHGKTGPSSVMWGVDDEIKHETERLASALPDGKLPDYQADIQKDLERIKEMIYKEEKIFYPLCLENFSNEEWVRIYQDLPEMGPAFIKAYPRWEKGEEALTVLKEEDAEKNKDTDGIIHFEAGQMTIAQLKALIDVLPMDITFIDENDINRFYSNKGKVFSRPLSSLGRPVYDCHPARIKPVVKNLIQNFKDGKQDTWERWTPNPLHPIRITYAAVRDKEGKYLGTVEIVQDFTDVRKHFFKK